MGPPPGKADFHCAEAELRAYRDRIPVGGRYPLHNRRKTALLWMQKMKNSSLSLPARLAVSVMLVLVATTVSADLMAVRGLRRDLAVSVSESLSGMVRRMAEQLDADLGAMLEQIGDEASRLEGMDAEEAGRFLRQRGTALEFAFDYGVVLVDAGGRVLADSMGRDWGDLSLAGEEFFQRTFSRDEPIVSEPFRSPAADGAPVVMIAAPVRDGDGTTVAVLAGGLDALRNRSLNQPTGVRASRYGQFGVFTRDGTVVAHSDRRLVLESYENPLPDHVSATQPGKTAEIVTADGHPALLAAAELRSAGWVLAGVFSSEEVFRPIESGVASAHWWFALGLLASCCLVWLVARWWVRDVVLLTREVEGIGGELLDATGARVGEGYRDEAGMLAGAINGMLAAIARSRRDVDDLSARLAENTERERRSIAADLHDSVCQSLALANMRLGGIRKRLADGGERGELEGVRELLERSVGELRSLTFNLSPGILYELGLVPALEWYAGEFGGRYGVRVAVSSEGDFSGLDEGRAVFLYRAVGELLANAAKHSGGKAFRVEAVGRDGGVVVAVEDDGVGYDGKGDGRGFGLRHLRERLRRFGGELVFSIREGGGTRAAVRLPPSR